MYIRAFQVYAFLNCLCFIDVILSIIRIIFRILHTQAYLISTNFVTFNCVLPLRYYYVNFYLAYRNNVLFFSFSKKGR